MLRIRCWSQSKNHGQEETVPIQYSRMDEDSPLRLVSPHRDITIIAGRGKAGALEGLNVEIIQYGDA